MPASCWEEIAGKLSGAGRDAQDLIPRLTCVSTQVAELELQGAQDSSNESNKEDLSQTLEELELLIKSKDEVTAPEQTQQSSRAPPHAGANLEGRSSQMPAHLRLSPALCPAVASRALSSCRPSHTSVGSGPFHCQHKGV